MNILEHRALRGPNFYSRKPVIFMLLDIGRLEETPSDEIPGFPQRLETLLPGLREHHCSPGRRGGFLDRLARGTWAAHIVEHVALELQVMAGMDVGFGKTRTTKDRGVYTVAYRYHVEEVGLQAGRDAVNLVESVVAGKAVDVNVIVDRLKRLRIETSLGPSTQSLVDAARRRGIPVMQLDPESHIQLGHGAHQQRIDATLTGRTAQMGVDIADDKDRTKRLLKAAGVPVPTGGDVGTLEEAAQLAARIGWPVTLKPLRGNHGRGVTTNVRDREALARAFAAAREVHHRVVVEQHLEGSDHRILVVDHRMVAAARRDPAQVVGDGRTSVRGLVEATNRDPRRGDGHTNTLTRIELDDATHEMLAVQGLTLDSVPPEGMVVVLKPTANLSTGGTATDVTDEVHPSIRAMSERVSRIVGLDVMGIDVVAPTLRRPLSATGGGVVEVNAAPGLRMHLEPSAGVPRDVAGPIIDMLFPHGNDGRIPIVAVTGTNGKTTTVRLLSHILTLHGGRVGMTTTSGVEIQGQCVLEGDYSGPSGARAVLSDPSVDHAVLEIARGGILRRGLAFDACDVGVMLNLDSDHLGEGGIETLDDLARLKGTVLEVVRESGAAVLNAEDPRVMAQRSSVRGRLVLFALDPRHPEFRRHVEDGGTGVTLRDEQLVVQTGGSHFPLLPVRDVPLTLGGVARFNVQNALAAAAAAHALGVPPQTICTALATFTPTPTQLPGRLNLFDLGRFRVLVDYGHNVAALRALAQTLPHLAPGRIVNVASCSGNRRDQDLVAFGRTIASMYHRILLCDPDPRGRELGETCDLVRQGLQEAGYPEGNVQVVLDETRAIDEALAMAQEGDLVVLQVDDVTAALRRVRSLQGGVDAVELAARPPNSGGGEARMSPRQGPKG